MQYGISRKRKSPHRRVAIDVSGHRSPESSGSLLQCTGETFVKTQIWPLIGVLLLSQEASAQTVYKVPADSKGNSFILTVANESQTTSAQAVMVRLIGAHPALKLTPANATLKTLPANGTSDVTFTFDIGRDVKPNRRDTLNFEIRDKTGGTWTKSIMLEYVGPKEFKLEQNFPNPFNPTTTIYYDLPSESRVSIAVCDILGREVTRLVDETKDTGYHSAKMDAHNLASGAYIYRIVAQPVTGGKAFTNVKKLMVLK